MMNALKSSQQRLTYARWAVLTERDMSLGAVRGTVNSSRQTGQVVERKVWDSRAVVCSCLSRSRSCLHAATSCLRRQLTLVALLAIDVVGHGCQCYWL